MSPELTSGRKRPYPAPQPLPPGAAWVQDCSFPRASPACAGVRRFPSPTPARLLGRCFTSCQVARRACKRCVTSIQKPSSPPPLAHLARSPATVRLLAGRVGPIDVQRSLAVAGLSASALPISGSPSQTSLVCTVCRRLSTQTRPACFSPSLPPAELAPGRCLGPRSAACAAPSPCPSCCS